jgi:hypothetical protein
MAFTISPLKYTAKSEIDTAKQSTRKRKLSGNADPSHTFGMRVEAKKSAHRRRGHFRRAIASNRAHAPTLIASPIRLPCVIGSPAKETSSQSIAPTTRESTKGIPRIASRSCGRFSAMETGFRRFIVKTLSGSEVRRPSPISAQ